MSRPARSAISDDAPCLVRALAAEDDAHPLTRKLLVAATAGAGRELLHSLARARGGWTGFEVTTVRPLAVQTAVEWIAAEGVRVCDAFEEEAYIDESLDAALLHDPHGDTFSELAEGPGFRRAVRDSVQALRLTGLDADAVERGGFESREKQFLLAAVLRRYEAALTRASTTDVAGLLDRASRALDRGAPLPAARILLLPGLSLRGRAGRFVQALERRGATRLPADPVVGLDPPRGMVWHAAEKISPLGRVHDSQPAVEEGLPLFDQAAQTLVPPDVHLFRAAGLHEELREVIRRILDSGRRFDEVEIVTPDPGAYGPTLHTLCSRLGIDTTFAVGLPVARTRPGRAVTAWLKWVADDCPSPTLRRLLESGDLVAPGSREADSPFLARTLRSLRIGWGRNRYRSAIRAALKHARSTEPQLHRYKTFGDDPERRAQRLRNLQSLDRLLRTILDAGPDPRGEVSPAAVARGLSAFLALVPAESEVDRSAHERLLRILDRIATTLVRPTRFATALTTVGEHLDIRVPAPRAEGRAPWLADGGALHLSDLEHGGLSGRPLLFIVGMDAGRFPGGTRQDPFLLDRERRTLHPDLPVVEDRIRERRFRLAALLARARGRVTVSYSAWEAGEARWLQPASIVLSLFRLRAADRSLGYGDLDAYLGPPVSRIPRRHGPIDRDDVWLAALDDDGRLLDGRAAVRAGYEALDRGLAAAEAPRHPAPSTYVGFLAPSKERTARLDPRIEGARALSASSLQGLGTCPLRYFYNAVLRVRKPEDPEFDLERWLQPPARGSLLHDVFQRVVDQAVVEQWDFDAPTFLEAALEVLTERAEAMKLTVPPPSDAVFRAEIDHLRADVRSFCAHLAANGPDPHEIVGTEIELGGDGPVTLRLPDEGTLRLRGRIDRVDLTDEGLRIIDYKTGKDRGHGPDHGVYDGGRRLQHVLYARAFEALRPELPPVARVEYHFPTVRGENRVHAYGAARLADGLALISRLVTLPAMAHFPPTNDAADCRFCDYRDVCRFGAVNGDDGQPSAPRVEWTRARFAERHESVDPLRAVREHEDGNG